MKLLLVEDDLQLGTALRHGLERAGFVVDWLQRGDDAASAASADSYALALLDLELPELPGLDVLRHIRKQRSSYLPVIIISARDRKFHRIEGLDAGADDYVVKPFDLDELVARIRAQLRRRDGRGSEVIAIREVEIDLSGRSVVMRGASVAITAKEFKILALLARRAGRFVTKADLEAEIYDDTVEIESNTVEVAISAIRRKLGRDFIATARGLGYTIPR